MGFLINLCIRDNLKSKEIGDKLFRETLEIIDRREEMIICLNSSGEAICYGLDGFCLSEPGGINIGTYSFEYYIPRYSSFGFDSDILKRLEEELNSLCHGKLKKIKIFRNKFSEIFNHISHDFNFLISDNMLKITIPKTVWLAVGIFPEDLSDPSKLIVFQEELGEEMILDIEISDLTRRDRFRYNREKKC